MNRERRKRLAALKLDEVKAELESIRDEEQEAYDNMPESLQDGERGEAMAAIVDALEEVVSALDSFADVEL
jgi:hypothetical protein